MRTHADVLAPSGTKGMTERANGSRVNETRRGKEARVCGATPVSPVIKRNSNSLSIATRSN